MGWGVGYPERDGAVVVGLGQAYYELGIVSLHSTVGVISTCKAQASYMFHMFHLLHICFKVVLF